MKKYILLSTIVAITISGSLIMGCDNASPSEKVEEAQTEVVQANQNLDEANDAYKAEIESYRIESDEKIAANERSIKEFRARVNQEKKEAKAEYVRKIEMLEKKNSDMKMKLDDYTAEGKEKWEMFKAEFNHDMDEMGNAIKDIGVKNVK